ncbi:hypothetical protein A3F45_00255 [Candidatus Curtissbacteria bacterium RIFCSPHIGHO2_12_FULL_41_17]|uniref:Uncharacterized protein n=2 Tax=Candidatus Curtissiibacteriota TaxID=1752717 RepID=A0A1F5HJ78_9BACT|nr:MAG: hypothetical protein A2693_04715 [Candidatus Curtissbacteria bacterium RIFCSPHIGHO2_01_FULL_40_12]OGE04153.1 MAG: hypothetical protein A3F45_00255 [Candidatus Curtissbacteria bacterium RIFCSPHIGHO2_12_FULL_41_17]
MSEDLEKRGPIEKSPKGWPINPFGVAALLIFTLIIIFLIVRPLIGRTNLPIPGEMTTSSGGSIIMPQAGEITKGDTLTLELEVDQPENVDKVQFWLKTYVDGNWQMIGEVKSFPFKFDWQIPSDLRNKAVAVTSHIYKKDGNIIKDPGGWREGIIILSE